ncbi:hypothetical protein EON67_00330 [archaeon]|nr:MAG: hypothetical protein EON67_00330 [archaeon]
MVCGGYVGRSPKRVPHLFFARPRHVDAARIHFPGRQRARVGGHQFLGARVAPRKRHVDGVLCSHKHHQRQVVGGRGQVHVRHARGSVQGRCRAARLQQHHGHDRYVVRVVACGWPHTGGHTRVVTHGWPRADVDIVHVRAHADPTAFQDDDGQWYLIWKEDGNAVGLPTPIYLAPLSADGLSLTGAWTQLLVNDPHSWEGILTEAPWMVKHNGEYFLFYSGNIYAAYAIGVARAATVRGPFVKAASNPILHTNTSVSQPPFLGPGHCSVVQVGGAGGSHAILYHTWPYGTNINFGDPRHMMLDTVVWDAATGWPSLVTGGSPSSTQQPLP